MLLSILAFIVQFESFSHAAYFDRTQYTHGYGTKSTEAMCVSEEWAREEAMGAIEKHLKAVDRLPHLSQDQKRALASFSYNVGEGAFRNSRLYALVAKGRHCEARYEFDKWVYQSGRKLKGLVKRRAAERELFSNGLVCKQRAV